MEKHVTSHYWRVRVHATQEEQIFSQEAKAKSWCHKVAHTFNDKMMTFDVIEVTELTEIYRVKD